MKLDDGIDYELCTYDFDPVDLGLGMIGFNFAGSNAFSIVCKVKYQLDAGYRPLDVDTAIAERYETVRKSGRTTGDTTGNIFEVNAVAQVNYGNFTGGFSHK